MQLSYSKNVLKTEIIIQLSTDYVNISKLSLFIYLKTVKLMIELHGMIIK